MWDILCFTIFHSHVYVIKVSLGFWGFESMVQLRQESRAAEPQSIEGRVSPSASSKGPKRAVPKLRWLKIIRL